MCLPLLSSARLARFEGFFDLTLVFFRSARLRELAVVSGISTSEPLDVVLVDVARRLMYVGSFIIALRTV